MLVQEEHQRGLQRGQRELVRADDPGQRILADGLDPTLLAEHDPRLGTADQLVAAAGDQVGPRRDRFGQRRLLLETELGEIHERPGADVVDDRQAVGLAQADQFLQGTSAVNPTIL